MVYDPDAVRRYFDALGFGEYERHDASPEQRIKFELHARHLECFVDRGSRVLEIGAGPGRFTEILAALGCRATVVELSVEQLRLNRARAQERGYADAVEDWVQADIGDLEALRGQRFDAVVVFGGPFSYVLERRTQALAQCVKLMAPGGRILLSVMSKWGTVHAFLHAVNAMPPHEIAAVLRTGDVTPDTSPASAQSGHYFHMFTADEVGRFLQGAGLTVELLAASNALSTRWGDLLGNEAHFQTVLDLEDQATRSPGAVDMGTHIIAVAVNPLEGHA